MNDAASLHELFKDHFRLGFAPDRPPGELAPLFSKHFNALTPENRMKWMHVQPQPGAFDYSGAERLVAFAEEHGMEVTGHTLVWHQQTPPWVFQDEGGGPASKELLLKRMEEHIRTVMSHFRGRVRGWDVVNEALDDDGNLRRSPWLEIIGESYIEHAYRIAHETCPEAELYYNDYNLTTPAKRAGAIRLVKGLLDRGVPIHGIGEQAHYDVHSPTNDEMRRTLDELSSLGLPIHITELDMSVYAWTDQRSLYADGLPSDLAEKQAERYADLFRIFLEYSEVIERVTFWGTTDATSWKRYFPVRSRADYPLLFDGQGGYKPAFWAVHRVASGE